MREPGREKRDADKGVCSRDEAGDPGLKKSLGSDGAR